VRGLHNHEVLLWTNHLLFSAGAVWPLSRRDGLGCTVPRSAGHRDAFGEGIGRWGGLPQDRFPEFGVQVSPWSRQKVRFQPF